MHKLYVKVGLENELILDCHHEYEPNPHGNKVEYFEDGQTHPAQYVLQDTEKTEHNQQYFNQHPVDYWTVLAYLMFVHVFTNMFAIQSIPHLVDQPFAMFYIRTPHIHVNNLLSV